MPRTKDSDRNRMEELVKGFHLYTGSKISYSKLVNLPLHRLNYWIDQFPQVKAGSDTTSDFIAIEEPSRAKEAQAISTTPKPSVPSTKPQSIKIHLPHGAMIEIPI